MAWRTCSHDGESYKLKYLVSAHTQDMGKHNGKARKTGKSVGSALVNKARRDGKIGSADSYLYTTDTRRDTGIDSVIQQNDLEDLMSMVCGLIHV